MTRRQILKALKKEYVTKKREDNSHNIIILLNDKEIYVKIVSVSSNTIFSFNSKFMWEIKKGKVSGIRFIQHSSTLIKLKGFMQKENRVVILTNKPYKILKQINESDIEDVSDENYVHGILVTRDPFSIYDIL